MKNFTKSFLSAMLVAFMCCTGMNSFAQSTTLAGVAVPATGISPLITNVTPVVNNQVYSFSLTQATSTANFTQVTFTTSGTYSSSTDITAFSLYVNTLANSINGSTPVTSGSITASGPGTQTITLSTPYTLNVGVNNYFFIVPTVASSPVEGHTILIGSMSSSDISVSAGSVSGSVAATATMTLINPSITGSTGAARCGAGTLGLSATATGSAAIKWYNSSTGGSVLATGTSYTTPSIGVTTPYYAEATQPTILQTITLSDNTTSLAGPYYMDQRTDLHWFSSVNACTINSIDLYPYAAGTIVITMTDASGTILETATPFTVSSGQVSNTVPVTIPLGFSVPAGATNYRLGGDGSFTLTQAIYRGAANSTYGPYPATVAGFSHVGDAGGNSTATGTSGPFTGYGARAYFYNWNITLNVASTPRTTVTATVNPLPDAGAITGSSTACPGATTTLTNAASGGTWSSVTPSIGSISSGGVVTGIAVGTTTISYTVTNGCGTAAATTIVTVNPLPNAGSITGTASVCGTGTSTLADAAGGGVWSSVTPARATINSSGVVTGVSAGTSVISYAVTNSCGTAAATKVFTVNPLPDAGAITGTLTVCPTATTALSNISGGGVWSSVTPSVATVNSSGIVTGVTAGTTTISYTVTNGCGTAVTTTEVTVNPSPDAGTITGTPSVCPAASTSLSNATTGGVWSSVTPGVAVVNTSGTVTGIAAGTSIISYTVSNSCGAGATTIEVTVNPLPFAGVISGTPVVCPAATTMLATTGTGGVWTSATTSKATVGALSGVVTGVAAGTSTISYTASNTCGTAFTTVVVTVNPLPVAGTIAGPSALCPAGVITLTDAAPGGVWESETSAASVGPTGIVTGIAAGTTNISYSVTNSCGTAVAMKALTVNPLPDAGAITGTPVVCPLATITLSNTASGGIWTSVTPSRATIGTSSGIVTGVSAGTTTISYTVINSCGTAVSSVALTVNPLPNVGTIIGTSVLCPTISATLTDAAPGGVWSSVTPATAVISSSGILSGIAAGTTVISYAVTNSCGTGAATKVVTVNPSPDAGAISGTPIVCPLATTALTNPAVGGVWSSVTPAKATVNSSGVVTGVSAGNTTISYTVTNSCGTAVATSVVTVNPLPDAGAITGLTRVCPAATITLSDAAVGGTWSSVTPATATVASGVVSGIAEGTTVISYAVTNSCGTAAATVTVTVDPLPVVPVGISGSTSVCEAATITLTDATPGGVWVNSGGGSATVSPTGVVSGIAAGAVTISYIISNSCGNAYSTLDVTVDPLPLAGTITGAASVCESASTSLADAVSGGSWGSASTGIATVSSAGIVNGISAGTTAINYTVTNGCGSAVATRIITVDPLPNPGSIAGLSAVCVGSVITLSDPMPGGVWGSSSPANATVSGIGEVAGFATGATVISYSVTNGCGTRTATRSIVVNPLPDAGVIIGLSTVCVGASVTLSDAAPGGVWSRANTTATVAGGVVTGMSAGVDTIMYTVTNSCGTAAASKTISIAPLPYAGILSGPASVCIGRNITLSTSVSGGTWTASNTSASVSGGVVTGLATGVDTIIYTVANACGVDMTTFSVAVGMTYAAAITGPSSVCVGDTIVLANATAGGTWTRRNTSASVSLTGTVLGVTAGVDTIFYIVTSTCGSPAIATAVVTVNPAPFAAAITGPGIICQGSHIMLHSISAGGVWSSSNTAGANIDAAGLITATTPGTYTISYRITNVCGTDVTTKALTIESASPAITGEDTVCPGATIVVTAPNPGGTWQSANSYIASVTNGIVTGVTQGVTNITYLGTNSCGPTTSSRRITVLSSDACTAIVGAAGNNNKATFEVFPNPTNGTINIKGTLAAAANDEVTVEVTNMVGQTVYSGLLNTHSGVVSGQVTLAHTVANGMYLLIIRSGDQKDIIHIAVAQ